MLHLDQHLNLEALGTLTLGLHTDCWTHLRQLQQLRGHWLRAPRALCGARAGQCPAHALDLAVKRCEKPIKTWMWVNPPRWLTYLGGRC